MNHWPTKESNTEEGPSYQIEDEEGPVQTKQQEESTDMEIATMVEGRNKSNKEINKLTAFDGSWKKVEMFIQECRLYLQVNKKIYTTDEAKVAFFLSFMTEKEALKWKQTFLRSITNDDGEMNFLPSRTLLGCLTVTSNPQTKPRMRLTNSRRRLCLWTAHQPQLKDGWTKPFWSTANTTWQWMCLAGRQVKERQTTLQRIILEQEDHEKGTLMQWILMQWQLRNERCWWEKAPALYVNRVWHGSHCRWHFVTPHLSPATLYLLQVTCAKVQVETVGFALPPRYPYSAVYHWYRIQKPQVYYFDYHINLNITCIYYSSPLKSSSNTLLPFSFPEIALIMSDIRTKSLRLQYPKHKDARINSGERLFQVK